MTTIDATRERIRRATEAAQNMRDREVDAELKAQARGQADAYYVIMNMVKDITPEELAPSAMRELGTTLRRLRNELQYVYEYEYTLEGMELIARWSIEWFSDIIVRNGGEAVLLPVRPEAVPEAPVNAAQVAVSDVLARLAENRERARDERGRFMPITSMPPNDPPTFVVWDDIHLTSPAPTARLIRGLYGWAGSTANISQRTDGPLRDCNCSTCATARLNTGFQEGMMEGTP